jgi:hypothetical protein
MLNSLFNLFNSFGVVFSFELPPINTLEFSFKLPHINTLDFSSVKLPHINALDFSFVKLPTINTLIEYLYINNIYLGFLLGLVLLYSINSILNTRHQTRNMRYTRGQELIRRLRGQTLLNLPNNRRVYLNRNYPRSCSLYDQPDLLILLNFIITANNDGYYEVVNNRACYAGTHSSIRSCHALSQIVVNH